MVENWSSCIILIKRKAGKVPRLQLGEGSGVKKKYLSSSTLIQFHYTCLRVNTKNGVAKSLHLGRTFQKVVFCVT